ncbi:hypothetical protein [Streptomyces sp. MH60]|uniref:hypothetical protein n=1 Tax=Streptomyces sp. MH60 TaxID=1940758 RepID=UPI000D4DAFB6|nr:hypothetical protein [Streptomyces sp. MH60]PPS91037.1 hypothetical protein BZZ08_00635 [Streptomyces sp. MH60]
MSEPILDDLRCSRCGQLPEPLLRLGHRADGTPTTDSPAAMVALEAKVGLADDARHRATGAALTDTQTAALLRATADGPDLGICTGSALAQGLGTGWRGSA